jgi:Sec-independent protein secretion pathway component TatC
MAVLTRSLANRLGEVKRANRAVSLELASIVSFLAGLALAVIALWPAVFAFMISVIPEDKKPSLDEIFFPGLALSKWGILITSLVFLIPAAILMSTGVVMRHFWEKK